MPTPTSLLAERLGQGRVHQDPDGRVLVTVGNCTLRFRCAEEFLQFAQCLHCELRRSMPSKRFEVCHDCVCLRLPRGVFESFAEMVAEAVLVLEEQRRFDEFAKHQLPRLLS